MKQNCKNKEYYAAGEVSFCQKDIREKTEKHGHC